MSAPNKHIRLQQAHLTEMIEHIQQQMPTEACGLLAGESGESRKVLPVQNMLNSPVEYRMEPQGQLDALLLIERRGWDMMALYHSHPVGPDHLSTADIEQANYPEAVHLVFFPEGGKWKFRGFTIDENGINAVKIDLTS